MKKPKPIPTLKTKLLKLSLALVLFAALLCVQGCSNDDAENPWWLPVPWLPVG
jgi:hypothetical protein